MRQGQGYWEDKEDRLWAVAERRYVLELAMRRSRIPSLASRFNACGVTIDWKECYQAKPGFHLNKDEGKFSEGSVYQRFCR